MSCFAVVHSNSTEAEAEATIASWIPNASRPRIVAGTMDYYSQYYLNTAATVVHIAVVVVEVDIVAAAVVVVAVVVDIAIAALVSPVLLVAVVVDDAGSLLLLPFVVAGDDDVQLPLLQLP